MPCKDAEEQQRISPGARGWEGAEPRAQHSPQSSICQPSLSLPPTAEGLCRLARGKSPKHLAHTTAQSAFCCQQERSCSFLGSANESQLHLQPQQMGWTGKAGTRQAASSAAFQAAIIKFNRERVPAGEEMAFFWITNHSCFSNINFPWRIKAIVQAGAAVAALP